MYRPFSDCLLLVFNPETFSFMIDHKNRDEKQLGPALFVSNRYTGPFKQQFNYLPYINVKSMNNWKTINSKGDNYE